MVTCHSHPGEQVQTAVAGMRPVRQPVVPVNEQADQRRAHPAIVLNGLLFAQNGAIRRLHVVTDMLRVEVLVAIEAGDNAVTGQFRGDFTTGRPAMPSQTTKQAERSPMVSPV